MYGYKIKPPDQEEYKHSQDIYDKIDSNALVCVWEEPEDSFFSKCDCCYKAVVATSVSDNMCSYLKQILGGCPGIKNLSKRFCVWEESEDCSKGVDSIDTLMSNLGSCYTAVMATSQPSFEEEKVRMWEKFEDCSRGNAGIDIQ